MYCTHAYSFDLIHIRLDVVIASNNFSKEFSRNSNDTPYCWPSRSEINTSELVHYLQENYICFLANPATVLQILANVDQCAKQPWISVYSSIKTTHCNQHWHSQSHSHVLLVKTSAINKGSHPLFHTTETFPDFRSIGLKICTQHFRWWGSLLRCRQLCQAVGWVEGRPKQCRPENARMTARMAQWNM